MRPGKETIDSCNVRLQHKKTQELKGNPIWWPYICILARWFFFYLTHVSSAALRLNRSIADNSPSDWNILKYNVIMHIIRVFILPALIACCLSKNKRQKEIWMTWHNMTWHDIYDMIIMIWYDIIYSIMMINSQCQQGSDIAGSSLRRW